MSGHESPYDLMEGEVGRIISHLSKRADERAVSNSLKKYSRNVEDNNMVSEYEAINYYCPNCHSSGGLLHHQFKDGDEGIYSTILCAICGWSSSLKEMLRQIRNNS